MVARPRVVPDGQNGSVIGARAHRVAVAARPRGVARRLCFAGDLAGFGAARVPVGAVSLRSERATPSVTAVKCPPEGVRFEVGEGDAAMGLRVLGITLVNCGTRDYRLNGYPDVRCRSTRAAWR